MSKESPIIIGFVADLMLQTEIETVAGRLGYQCQWIDSAQQLGPIDPTDRPGEPLLAGQSAQLTQQLSRHQPLLLIFDLQNQAIPVLRWIGLLKSSPATRRFPILAFGSSPDETLFEQAHQAGAEGIVTHEQFVDDLPDLINKYALRHDYLGIFEGCEGPLSDLGREGIELFNQKQFYEAHHGLEAAWNFDNTPARDFYRAILQVAVAYLQIERGNFRGAVKMFLRAQQWFEPLPDRCHGVDIAYLRASAQQVHDELLTLGAENITAFDPALFRPIKFSDPD